MAMGGRREESKGWLEMFPVEGEGIIVDEEISEAKMIGNVVFVWFDRPNFFDTT